MVGVGESAIDGATVEGLLDAVGGDRAFLAELMDAFVDDAPRQLRAMRDAVESDSAGDLVRPAHTLKASSGSLGALALAERCGALETQARSGDLTGADDAVDAIAALLERSIADLRVVVTA